MNISVIIPARYSSSRFPGKPLAKLGGREVILHVVDQVVRTGFASVVATDDQRILECIQKAGYNAVMTDENHRCGTDRVYEAMTLACRDADVVINVQGDEPFIHPSQIRDLARIFDENAEAQIATLVRPLGAETTFAELADPSLVKCVVDECGRAMYFSRYPIPFQRGVPQEDWCKTYRYLSHVGVYAYRPDVLARITSLRPSDAERAESLEQLRWLQAGISIYTVETDKVGVGIDTPDDLIKAEEVLLHGS